jgi:hypothetical protein
MFKKIKILILSKLWSLLPRLSSKVWLTFKSRSLSVFYIVKDLIGTTLPLFRSIIIFFSDLRFLIFSNLNWVWALLTKHRLIYILRLVLLIFILYKPTLMDLDSVYWLFSTFFYFVANTIFFVSSYILPFWEWSFQAPSLKFVAIFSIFPALFSAKRLKKRLRKRRKIILQDDEVFFIFRWAQRIFAFTVYFLFFYFSFLLFSCLIPLFYVYFFSNTESLNLSFIIYFFYFKKIKYLSILFNFFAGPNFIYYAAYFIKLVPFSIFLTFSIYLNPIFLTISKILIKAIITKISYFFIFFLVLIKIYFFEFFNIFKDILTLSIFLKNSVLGGSPSLNLSPFLAIYKNFLFSDNFLIFSFYALESLFRFTLLLLSNIVYFVLGGLSFALKILIPNWFLQAMESNFSYLYDSFLIYFYSTFIRFLDYLIPLLNSYLKDLTFFGLLSTWFGYLSHGVQRGILSNSFINWLLIHLYASIIAFWFLDFDFRVSVKTPPKSPNTLLKEAKKTQDWIPQNMDFLTLQTSETTIYFAMLDISFEHVESLHFIYGDFEYVDEEYDSEDETPDEEEFYNDSEETLKVREIIDADLGFTKRPIKMSDLDPLDPKGGLERHYLGEIVGEPELLYIEEPLKWAFSALYSPSFEELHFKDSLFSEWLFDPDEDLTFFEFLFLFPIIFYFVYVWFFHRRRKRHYREYLRFFIPVRRTAFSGWWIEDFLGIPIGEWSKYFFDKMRSHTAPDVRFKRLHKFRMYRNRQKFKLMHLEAFHFERLRLKLYKDSLKNWEDFTAKSITFLAPNRKKHYMYSTVLTFKKETREWAMFGDWTKFFWKPEPTPERISRFYESLQANLGHLMDKYLHRRRVTKKFRRNLWRTVQHVPGHLSMPYYPKYWYSRFTNIFLYFPGIDTKYNYNYYNYMGWRNNRSRWRRYAFTPGNVNDKVFSLNRSLRRRDYNLLKRWQRRRRLMRVFQF